jgi:hypothetical protein
MRGNLTTAPAFGATHIPQYPLELLAYHHPDSVHRLVSYSYCCRYHWHGQPAGHRVAHCPDRNSPYEASGYTLVDAEPASPELLRDAKSKCARGPGSWGHCHG